MLRVPPLAVVDRSQIVGFAVEFSRIGGLVSCALDRCVAAIGRVLGGDQIRAGQNILLQILVVASDSHVAGTGDMLYKPVVTAVPRAHIIRDGMPVIAEKG